MKKINGAAIKNVAAASPAEKSGIKCGDILYKINGKPIFDVLDYKFYMAQSKLKLTLESGVVRIFKDEYEDLGLEFDTYLMSGKQRCRNNCVFCFINQLPKNMRETLYFKDDDARLSFLQGNYITLTNLTDSDIKRIIKMKLNVNVSVHTTNPELRNKLLQNPEAGKKLKYLFKMAEKGININCQLVLCKGLNDGDELRRSLTELTALYPSVGSIACVPAGLTKYRRGLFEIEPYTPADAAEIIDIIEEFGNRFYAEMGDRIVYPSDEFFLLAGRKIPDYDYYGDFLQYENGVGMTALLRHEFTMALRDKKPVKFSEKSIATGVLAAPIIKELAALAGARVKVYAIRNDFFGESITVAGLVTGGDLINQLLPYKNELGRELLIPSAMLRAGESVFLDDVTVREVEKKLGIKVNIVDGSGDTLLDALI